MNKKIIASVMASIMVIGMTACNTPEPAETTAETTTEITEPTTEVTETTTAETTTEVSETIPSLSPDEYGTGFLGEATDFDWGNASLGVVTYDGMTYPDAPTYPAGENIDFSFKSNNEYTLFSVVKFKEELFDTVDGSVIANAIAIDGIDGDVKDDCSFNVTDGSYELSLNADVVESGWCYMFAFVNNSGSYSYVTVRCV